MISQKIEGEEEVFEHLKDNMEKYRVKQRENLTIT